MKKSGIYKFTNKFNGKVYVGQAKDLKTRFDRHIYRLKRSEHHNTHVQRSYDKYGEDVFFYEIIEEVSDHNLLNEREKCWIDFYGGINSKKNYNHKDPLLNEFSDYVRKKQSRKMVGENNPNYGNRWSDDQRKKASEYRVGKTWEDLHGEEKAGDMKRQKSDFQKGRKHKEETKEKRS